MLTVERLPKYRGISVPAYLNSTTLQLLEPEDEINTTYRNVGDQVPSTRRDIQKDKNLHEHSLENFRNCAVHFDNISSLLPN